eukprot:TRINITY_DN2008_c0_g1_i3.p1 TRINITY_DN2008_c0_g1~~TRINITY_DN2008_c0_g1_i3.p1  ORF type:complete len:244 (+),score=49.87 TRINITY_DN2008_c0_g1_i3:97-732(+)
MADSDDYYVTLGLERDASEDDIKRAYKKAALRWHPDKNPTDRERSERVFKRVGEAYGVLSDPRKRERYDRGGCEGVADEFGGWNDDGFGMDDAFDIFNVFFGSTNPFQIFDDMFSNMGFGMGGLFGGMGFMGNMMGGMGGMGGLRGMGGMGGAMGGLGGAADTRPAEERFAPQLDQLVAMGFTDRPSNLQALQMANGNVNQAINFLLGGAD